MFNRIRRHLSVLTLYFAILFFVLTYWIRHNYQNFGLLLIDYQYNTYTFSLKYFLLLVVIIPIVTAAVLYMIKTSKVIVLLEINIFNKNIRYQLFKIKPIYILIIAIFVFLVFSPIKSFYNNMNTTTEDNFYFNKKLVAHAFGGTENGTTYTNSFDAFKYNYSLGHRVFEVDFSIASDGKVVLRHDWDQDIQTGIDSLHIPDSKTFISIPIYGYYTPMTFEDLLRLMEEYPDIYIVTDSKLSDVENVALEFKAMINSAKELQLTEVLDRLIVQIYNESMYTVIKKIWPFQHYIYTLYQRGFNCTEKDLDSVMRYCVNNNIDGITIWYYWWDMDYKTLMDKYGIEVYLHTVNDPDEASTYLKQGITGIYTDYINPETLEQ